MKDVDSCIKPRGAAKQALIRGCPNGKTQQSNPLLLPSESNRVVKLTKRTETSKYLQEKKSIEIPSVVASEQGTA